MPLELLLVLLSIGAFIGVCLFGLVVHLLGCLFN